MKISFIPLALLASLLLHALLLPLRCADAHGLGDGEFSNGRSLPAGAHLSAHPGGDVDDYHPILVNASFTGPIQFYSWHAHTYFFQNNAQASLEAEALREAFIAQFKPSQCSQCDSWCTELCLWLFNRSPIGPHTLGSWGAFIPLNSLAEAQQFFGSRHGNLSVLFHPNSGYPQLDHSHHALWFTPVVPLDISKLPGTETPPLIPAHTVTGSSE